MVLCLSLLLTLWFSAATVFAEDWIYTVRRGDTIWGLSHKYLKQPLRFKEIQEYNGVTFDRQIPPGTVLKFPLEYLKFGPAEVTVTSIAGQAQYIRRQQTFSLALDSKLTVGDRLITGEGSSVALLFADRSELLLGQHSELVFDVQTKWGDTGMVDSRMRLNKGSAEGRVQKLIGPGSHFEVHTPTAVATVRGTEFRVRVDENNAGQVFNEVSEGKVAVNLDQKQKLVNQGFGLKAVKGAPLVEPKPLLPRPDLARLKNVYPGHPVIMDWDTIEGAVNYKLELFADANLTQFIDVIDTDKTQIELPKIDPDTYYVRVKGVDAEGFQGLDSIHKFTITKVPASPVLKTTREANYLAGRSVTFEWNQSFNATHYLWQMSKSEDFSEVSYQQESDQLELIREGDIAPGNYYWRVAAINNNGRGPFAEAKSVAILLPAEPTIIEMDESIEFGEEFNAKWDAVELAESYYWQVASDANFTTIVQQGSSAEPAVTLSNLPQQTLYFRVAAKGPFNDKRFSQSSAFEVEKPDNGKTKFTIGSFLLLLLFI